MKEETKTFVIMVKINGQEARALSDSGCTTEATSLEMVHEGPPIDGNPYNWVPKGVNPG